jgi:DNA-binding MarR family transcriptional regulator
MTSHDGSVQVWLALMQARVALEDTLGTELEAKTDLPLSWFEVLMRLSLAEDGRMRMNDLAGVALLSKSGLTRLCDRIEAAGYIRRVDCPTDRRGVHAEITAEGRAIAERARVVFERAVVEHIGAHLSATEQATLTKALGKLAASNPCSRIPKNEGFRSSSQR